MNTLPKKTFLFVGLILLTAALFLLDIALGSVRLPLEALLSDNPIYHEIIVNFRLPKALTAIITGASISVAGLLMQTLFRNPLAGPYVLGVSSGSSLGVAIFLLGSSILPITFIQSGWGLVISAILGGILVLLLVLGVSFRVRQTVSLLIVGIMFGQIAGSLVTILQNNSNPDALKLFVVWTFGSLSAVSWTYMQVMLPLVVIGLVLALSIQKSLNGLLLGENYAQGLGINIVRTRVLIIMAVALLAGTTTAFTGPIAFIGMAVPHLVRGLFRTSDHRVTIPGTMLCGASLLLLCDLATQLPADGYTLPINAISALVGAPIIIWIILKKKGNNARTTNLHIGYGRRAVQSDLNLHANARDLICLTGTNGCGKSTLLRTLAGLQKPLKGDITIQGKSVQKLSSYERSTLFSLVLTDSIDTENLTVHDLVALGRFPYTNWAGSLLDTDEAKIAEALQQVSLTHKAHCYLTEISDGEKQRAVIAKALAQDTPLVLLDEPTAHLDLPNRIEIMLLLRRLSVNTQKTFILSTHELDLALQMADKIWLMGEHGVEVGIPEDLMLTGKFQEAFGSHSFQFDENDGHCKINHLVGPLHVNVIGEKPATLWLQHALLRCGIQLSESASITIEAHDGVFRLHNTDVHSIEEILKLLMD